MNDKFPFQENAGLAKGGIEIIRDLINQANQGRNPMSIVLSAELDDVFANLFKIMDRARVTMDRLFGVSSQYAQQLEAWKEDLHDSAPDGWIRVETFPKWAWEKKRSALVDILTSALDELSLSPIETEVARMPKIEVTLGDGTTIHGDFVVANMVKDSFNKADKADVSNELKDTLKELAKAVANMSAKLPTDAAQQVARDLETLTLEATSKSPRNQWWQLSVEGLTKAAKDIGEIGKPVLELASKIVALLSVM